jgi:hypothetical protein
MRAQPLPLFVLLALAGVAVGVAGCGNDIPPFPTYSKDIQPLMQAHCVRCHGAGGTLNTDPDIPPDTNPQDPRSSYVGTPKNGYFTQLADVGPGKLGLMSYSGQNPARVLMNAALPYMPPPPAPPLTDWEHDLLVRWLDNPRP